MAAAAGGIISAIVLVAGGVWLWEKFRRSWDRWSEEERNHEDVLLALPAAQPDCRGGFPAAYPDQRERPVRTFGLLYRAIYRIAEIAMMVVIAIALAAGVCWTLLKEQFTGRRADWPFETWVGMIGPLGKEENKT